MDDGYDIFVHDMFESVKIIDLARLSIEVSSLSVKVEKNHNVDIEIEIASMCPGEQLFKEF